LRLKLRKPQMTRIPRHALHVFAGSEFAELTRFAFAIDDYEVAHGNVVITEFSGFSISRTHFPILPLVCHFLFLISILKIKDKVSMYQEKRHVFFKNLTANLDTVL